MFEAEFNRLMLTAKLIEARTNRLVIPKMATMPHPWNSPDFDFEVIAPYEKIEFLLEPLEDNPRIYAAYNADENILVIRKAGEGEHLY